MERERVSWMMLKSLCGCPTTKVAIEDAEHTVQIGPSTKAKVTFIKNQQSVVYIGSGVVKRGLIGTLISSLERKELKTIELKYTVADAESLKRYTKLHRLSKFPSTTGDIPSVISLWEGPEVYKRIKEAVRMVREKYSLDENDIVWSESSAQCSRDSAIWFSQPVTPQVDTTRTEVPDSEEAKKSVEIEDKPERLRDAEIEDQIPEIQADTEDIPVAEDAVMDEQRNGEIILKKNERVPVPTVTSTEQAQDAAEQSRNTSASVS